MVVMAFCDMPQKSQKQFTNISYWLYEALCGCHWWILMSPLIQINNQRDLDIENIKQHELSP